MKKSFLKSKKVLITSGPTRVPIDEMRVLSNKSSGQLGRLLAERMSRQGAQVTLLEGPVTEPLRLPSVKVVKFVYFQEFFKKIKKELKKKYDICIHAAAVSDFQLTKSFRGKISSEAKSLRLNLVPTPKIVNFIKKWNPGILLVAFKLEPALTSASARRKSRQLFQTAQCDFVVANSLDNGKYRGWILDKARKILAAASSREKMAEALIKTISMTDRRLQSQLP